MWYRNATSNLGYLKEDERPAEHDSKPRKSWQLTVSRLKPALMTCEPQGGESPHLPCGETPKDGDLKRRRKMSEITQIQVALIDPKSEVNVRRQGVEQNVEQVKASIQQHGYWQDQPIIVRPHPNTASGYDYQHVTGQCRFKACLELGLEEIPAFILELDDDEAIQRSWLENEVRGDLTYSDQAYWTERIFKRYNGDGYTADEAIELAAKFLG